MHATASSTHFVCSTSVHRECDNGGGGDNKTQKTNQTINTHTALNECSHARRRPRDFANNRHKLKAFINNGSRASNNSYLDKHTTRVQEVWIGCARIAGEFDSVETCLCKNWLWMDYQSLQHIICALCVGINKATNSFRVVRLRIMRDERCAVKKKRYNLHSEKSTRAAAGYFQPRRKASSAARHPNPKLSWNSCLVNYTLSHVGTSM